MNSCRPGSLTSPIRTRLSFWDSADYGRSCKR
jgi:hypothetical protein